MSLGAKKRDMPVENGPDKTIKYPHKLKPKHIIELFKTGIYHETRNPNGQITIDKFIEDDYNNKKTKMHPKDKNYTNFAFGSLKKPIRLAIKKNTKYDGKDSNGKSKYIDLDLRDGKGNVNYIFKIFGYPPGHQYHDEQTYKCFLAIKEMEKCQQQAIIFNTDDKIEAIKKETEKFKQKYKKDPEEEDLETLLGDNWFFDECNIPALQLKKRRVIRNEYKDGTYRPMITKNPSDETAPQFAKNVACMYNSQHQYSAKLWKILNPNSDDESELLLEQQVPRNAQKQFNPQGYRKYYDKVIMGWIEGYIKSLNNSKGWGQTPTVTDIYIKGIAPRQQFTSGRKAVVKGTGDMNSLFAEVPSKSNEPSDNNSPEPITGEQTENQEARNQEPPNDLW